MWKPVALIVSAVLVVSGLCCYQKAFVRWVDVEADPMLNMVECAKCGAMLFGDFSQPEVTCRQCGTVNKTSPPERRP